MPTRSFSVSPNRDSVMHIITSAITLRSTTRLSDTSSDSFFPASGFDSSACTEGLIGPLGVCDALGRRGGWYSPHAVSAAVSSFSQRVKTRSNSAGASSLRKMRRTMSSIDMISPLAPCSVPPRTYESVIAPNVDERTSSSPTLCQQSAVSGSPRRCPSPSPCGATASSLSLRISSAAVTGDCCFSPPPFWFACAPCFGAPTCFSTTACRTAATHVAMASARVMGVGSYTSCGRSSVSACSTDCDSHDTDTMALAPHHWWGSQLSSRALFAASRYPSPSMAIETLIWFSFASARRSDTRSDSCLVSADSVSANWATYSAVDSGCADDPSCWSPGPTAAARASARRRRRPSGRSEGSEQPTKW
eukprot:Opistho-1_new@29267